MFSKKRLKVVIQNVEGDFTEGVNTLTFEDMPIEVNLTCTRLPSGISGKIKIYGVSKEHLDMITTIKWKQDFITQKAVYVYANDGEGYSLLFEGNIMSAIPSYDGAPEVCIDIDAVAGAFHNLKELPPFSLKGNVPVASVFEQLCRQYGVDFKNNGVEGSCSNPFFDDSGLANRVMSAAKSYNVNTVMYNNRLEIYPKDGQYDKTWNFTKNSYIGYPKITATGIQIVLDKVSGITLEDFMTISGSEVSAANDTWKVIKTAFNLSTKIGGKWIMSIDAQRVIR